MLRINECFILPAPLCMVSPMNGEGLALVTSDPAAADPWAAGPLPAALAAEIRSLIARLDDRQRVWLSGFLAGSVQVPAAAAAPAGETGAPGVTILFGSHTGNSERLAKRIVERLTQLGIRHTLLDMIECRKTHLQGAQNLLVVVSTHGNGDPPERAQPLVELLMSRKAPRLEHLKFAVLALGDSSYEKFCETGRQFDARLEALGAARLHARADCDVDFDTAAEEWIEGVVKHLQPDARAPIATADGERRSASVSNAYTRKQPFLAPLLANTRLTATGSTKDVRHVELSVEGANLHYEPGDALGIVTHNRHGDVDAVLARLPLDPQSPVEVSPQSTLPLRQALTERYEIGPITVGFLKAYAEASGSDALAAQLAGDAAALARYVRERHLVDVLGEHPTDRIGAAALARMLRPIAPRLYSIASSQRAISDEVHLTVAVVEYDTLGQTRRGLVSGQVADLTGDETALPVYLHRNAGFRLPTDPSAPIIMIGAGTGVAPFRAFVAERAALGATGRNWLIFGDRAFETDFLYQAEWLDWRKRRVLSNLDVAFSRDQAEKTYVQHRIAERGAQLWRWIEEGAHLYVCGDALNMAPDVHRALIGVITRHGGRSAENAAELLVDLQRTRRYQRDVY